METHKDSYPLLLNHIRQQITFLHNIFWSGPNLHGSVQGLEFFFFFFWAWSLYEEEKGNSKMNVDEGSEEKQYMAPDTAELERWFCTENPK